jgi:hypothetical protein
MNTNQKISLAILSKIANGMTARQAVDAVLGAGTFEKIAGDVYDTLRKAA